MLDKLEITKYLRNLRNVGTVNRCTTLNVNFLRHQKGIEVKSGITTSIDGKRDYVHLLNSLSKTSVKVNKECNCLLLTRDLEIIGSSFQNPDVGNNDSLFEKAPVLTEQLYDGKMVIITTYMNAIYMYTKGSINAEEYINDKTTITVKSAVTKLLNNKFDSFNTYGSDGSGLSYVFMYISNEHHNVTPYTKEDLILLSIIDKATMTELPRNEVDDYARTKVFSRPVLSPMFNACAIKDYINNGSSLNKGIVLVNVGEYRIEIKNRNYNLVKAIINSNKNNVLKRIATAILNGVDSEIYKYYPKFKKIFKLLNANFESVLNNAVSIFKLYNGADSMKTFAEKIKNNRYKKLLFAIKRGEINKQNDFKKFLNTKIFLKHSLFMCKHALIREINTLEKDK